MISFFLLGLNLFDKLDWLSWEHIYYNSGVLSLRVMKLSQCSYKLLVLFTWRIDAYNISIGNYCEENLHMAQKLSLIVLFP